MAHHGLRSVAVARQGSVLSSTEVYKLTHCMMEPTGRMLRPFCVHANLSGVAGSGQLHLSVCKQLADVLLFLMIVHFHIRKTQVPQLKAFFAWSTRL